MAVNYLKKEQGRPPSNRAKLLWDAKEIIILKRNLEKGFKQF